MRAFVAGFAGLSGTVKQKPVLDATGNTLRDDSGRIRYSQIIEWSGSELRTEISKHVVELIRQQYPDAFDGSGG
jgi:hypothetical protein